MKHFKFLSILSVFFLLTSCGPSGVEIRGQFYTSGADVPNFKPPTEGMSYVMWRNYGNGRLEKKSYLEPQSEQHAKDMVKVENGMCNCHQWYYVAIMSEERWESNSK